MNNVKKSIGWCSYSWNPVTGCKRGCQFCYAERIWRRFNRYVPFSKIQFHPYRLHEPVTVKNPSRIFVGSMSDIEYWSPFIVAKVINSIIQYPQHTFMFLSKNPLSYYGYKWPVNTMQGLTITGTESYNCQVDSFSEMVRYHSSFLSIEPLMGPLKTTPHINIDLVIVGAETGNRKGKAIPRKEWIKSIIDRVPAEKIYWKKNIKKYLEEYGL